MMAEKEDLGLSLSLNFPATGDRNPSSLQLNLMSTALVSSFSSFDYLHRNPNFSDSSPFSSDQNNVDVFKVETRSFLKGIDVNRILATTTETEEEAGVSSPNSTISSISGKRSERDLPVNENDGERASSRGISDDEDGENCRKKLRLSKDQSAVLEESFKEHNTLNHQSVVVSGGGEEERGKKESTEHVLHSCQFAHGIWDDICLWCHIPSFFAFGVSDLWKIHKTGSSTKKGKKALYGVVLATVWCIWKARNDAIFNNTHPRISKVIGDS